MTNACLVAASFLVKDLGAGQGNVAAEQVDKGLARGGPPHRNKFVSQRTVVMHLGMYCTATDSATNAISVTPYFT